MKTGVPLQGRTCNPSTPVQSKHIFSISDFFPIISKNTPKSTHYGTTLGAKIDRNGFPEALRKRTEKTLPKHIKNVSKTGSLEGEGGPQTNHHFLTLWRLGAHMDPKGSPRAPLTLPKPHFHTFGVDF